MNKIIFTLIAIFSFTISAQASEIEDLLRYTIDKDNLPQIYQNTKYDYSSIERVEVKLQLDESTKITTKKGRIKEGQKVQFRVKRDVKYKGKTLIPKFTLATGIIQTYISKGMNGIPATIIIDNIQIEGIDNTKVKGTIIRKGADFSLLVFTLKWALTILPPTGSLTNFIPGGNASISKKTDIAVYYYPNWGKEEI